MSLTLSYKNPNYCATVVELKNFKVLEGCDNLKAALVLGNQVIVSNNSHAGEIGLFFPVECQLSHDFLKANNLYRNSSFNVDPEKKGYFEENRRIRCVKLRGHKSEGIFLPLSSLEYLLGSKLQELEIGAEFDSINGTEVCCKYVLSSVVKHGSNNNGVPGEKAVSRLVEGQVTLHFDTLNLKKNIYAINPNDFISISNKVHGTSWVVGNVLVKRKLSWFERLLVKFKVAIVDKEYDVIPCSRNTIRKRHFAKTHEKNVGFVAKYNLWDEIAEKLKGIVPKGYTLYGEAVGYMATGQVIQKRYPYGFEAGEYGLEVYRITYTNPDGVITELSWNQVKEFCERNNLTMVQEIYYGRAIDFINDPNCTEMNFHEKFLEKLTANVENKMCPRNDMKVPLEGWVIRKDGLKRCESFKFKNILFVEGETKALDKGEIDIESDESAGD